jgi:hypothetical protein
MGAAVEIRAGQRYGKLTAIRPGPDKVSPSGKRTRMWVFRCDCENGEVEKRAAAVVSGAIRSCNCGRGEAASQRRIAAINIEPGMVFERLTAIAPAEHKKRNGRRIALWTFWCSCPKGKNKVFTFEASKVIRGNTGSCGCLRREHAATAGLKHGKSHTKAYKAQWQLEKSKTPEGRDYRRKQMAKLRRDPVRRMHLNIMSELSRSLKRGYKGSGTLMEILGYTIDELATHLELQFTPDMSWENYGTYWHIDHWTPASTFDLGTPNGLQSCWALGNLRPLDGKANMAKGAKRFDMVQPNPIPQPDRQTRT